MTRDVRGPVRADESARDIVCHHGRVVRLDILRYVGLAATAHVDGDHSVGSRIALDLQSPKTMVAAGAVQQDQWLAVTGELVVQVDAGVDRSRSRRPLREPGDCLHLDERISLGQPGDAPSVIAGK